MSRQRNFMPSRYVTQGHDESREVTPATTVARVTVARDTYRTKPQTHEEWRAKQIAEGLGRMRIAGRHYYDKPLNLRDLREWALEQHLPAEQAVAAYEAGVRDRAAGTRCMCGQCLGQTTGNPYDWRSQR